MKAHILFPIMLCGACSQGLGPVVPETQVERKMISLLEKFDRWDYNGDGQLIKSELTAGLEGDKAKAARVIDFYDTDHSGGISLKEAQAGYGRADEAEERIKAREAAERGAR